jgi:hypothetical protein
MEAKDWIARAGLLMCHVVAACAADSQAPAPSATASPSVQVGVAGAAASSPVPSGTGPVIVTKPATPSSAQPSMQVPMANPPIAKPAAGSGAPAMTTPNAMGIQMAPPAMPATMAPASPAAPAGPNDGDPSKPVVSLSEVPCLKGAGPGFGRGANFKVDDRDVIIDYPCDKHEGAPMTFILNLHGTTPVAQHFYQEGYFSAYKYVGSHNLIVATPSSVVEQWGNGDNGEDLPYLMHVIDWVYNTLGTKFEIRSMWVGGHSWGAFYTAQFGCRAELADKVRGLIIMSGSPTQPACASKMSVIDTNAEMDIAAPLEQGAIPMQHGCKQPMMNMLGNNTQTLWPDCMPGFVHSNYLMLGKMHIDSMDDVVVKSIVDLINQARP